ncbi:MAG: CTP synthase [Chloroflexota bacterium]|nr:CTP synthase [Chloroflexota bacterium]
MTKYIFVTGGVVSSVGKGTAVASIGRILKSRNISVSVQKLDPYLNAEPGLISPYQHGEVYLTHDGAETDLDLGHYERFIDTNLNASSSVSAGQVYSELITKERKGEFLGGTIQVIPSLTNEIKSRSRKVAQESGAEVVIIEVGGTVGDIEGLPFLEAIRQMRSEVGRKNVLYIHLTLLPYLQSTLELKTKPTQHSVNELRRIGIQPDVIILRSDLPITDDIRDKIALFCDVDQRAVLPLLTLPVIYETPLVLEEAGLGELIVEKLDLPRTKADFTEWRDLVERMKEPKESVTIALVGQYVELRDAYLSIREALRHAATYHDRDIEIQWIQAEDLERDGDNVLRSAQGIIVPGGSGKRGVEGMINAARYAREHNIPYLGSSIGMHTMIIDLARHILGSHTPNSTEFDPGTPHPVIDQMQERRDPASCGAAIRLGAYPCRLVPGTKAAAIYEQEVIYERYRQSFEFNTNFRDTLEGGGMVFSGLSQEGQNVDICELREHPFMIGCQYHPEFGSRPNRPHPLIREFIGVAKEVLIEGAQPSLPI